MFWNPMAERLYGWSSQEALGRTEQELFGTTVPVELKSKLELGGDWACEMHNQRKDGGQVVVHSRWSLTRDAAGQPESIVAVHVDLTEQKAIEAQYLRAQRLESIGTLASGIAHDLNNILTPILMSVGVLRLSAHDENSEHLITSIEDSAERGADIVRQILTFGRGVQGERMLVQSRHILNELVKILSQIFPKNISIKTRIANDLWPISGDATQIHQVLLNLCVNARDAMGDGGTLTLAAENIADGRAGGDPAFPEGPCVQLTISDTGQGIPKEVMDRIWDPFFTTKAPGKGTGLGLATVRGIVKNHQGHITLESELRKGATFRVLLPATVMGQVDYVQKHSEPPPRGNGEAILVVDDERSVRVAVAETLASYGYEVFAAEDGNEAAALFFQRREEIRVVLTDLEMEVMGGMQLVRTLQRIDPKVKVILSSGQCGDDTKAIFRAIGVRRFLDKPYSPERLLTIVHESITAAR